MYAECPHCHAIFRVTQEILDKAASKVRCGECKKIFAAITETPLNNKTNQNKAHQKTEDPQPENVTAYTQDIEPDDIEPDDSTTTGFSDNTLIRAIPFAQEPKIINPEIPSVFPADLSAYLPVIYAYPRRLRELRLPFNINTTAIAAFLLILFFTQYLRANRQELAEHVLLRPPLTFLCAVTGCEIQSRRDIDKIKLLSHGIYSHPEIENALMIKASMVNRANFEQVYPIVQVSLGNIKGHTIALRRFGANEYLDAKQSLAKKMPIDKPVSIEIEVVDPGEKALAFEFKFI
jgi:predicted Zn finger-like uncharacterized protein